jgi:anti-sigma B factor antagonist
MMAAVRDEAGVRVCRIIGDLDSYGSTAFRAAIARVADCSAVVVDLSGVAFIDSSGLGALIGAIRRLREVGGAVALCSARKPVDRVLRVAGVDRIVTLAGSVSEAVALLSPTDEVPSGS